MSSGLTLIIILGGVILVGALYISGIWLFTGIMINLRDKWEIKRSKKKPFPPVR